MSADDEGKLLWEEVVCARMFQLFFLLLYLFIYFLNLFVPYSTVLSAPSYVNERGTQGWLGLLLTFSLGITCLKRLSRPLLAETGRGREAEPRLTGACACACACACFHSERQRLSGELLVRCSV